MGKKKELERMRLENERLLMALEANTARAQENAPNASSNTAKAQGAKKPFSASFKIMNNNSPVPVAKPADFIQLTPIVQPLPIVPYSTQEQPLAQYVYDDENYYQ
ncbi:MAG: hypothetical protein FWD49_02100 [Firmicutes bacterium]|nr:hypothetical protein [Bacillota bacterium]